MRIVHVCFNSSLHDISVVPIHSTRNTTTPRDAEPTCALPAFTSAGASRRQTSKRAQTFRRAVCATARNGYFGGADPLCALSPETLGFCPTPKLDCSPCDFKRLRPTARKGFCPSRDWQRGENPEKRTFAPPCGTSWPNIPFDVRSCATRRPVRETAQSWHRPRCSAAVRASFPWRVRSAAQPPPGAFTGIPRTLRPTFCGKIVWLGWYENRPAGANRGQGVVPKKLVHKLVHTYLAIRSKAQ